MLGEGKPKEGSVYIQKGFTIGISYGQLSDHGWEIPHGR